MRARRKTTAIPRSTAVATAAAALAAASALGLIALPRAARADDATAQARSHYEMGLKLFDAREHEQALVEFKVANDLKPRPDDPTAVGTSQFADAVIAQLRA